jgi:hypothetical protein
MNDADRKENRLRKPEAHCDDGTCGCFCHNGFLTRKGYAEVRDLRAGRERAKVDIPISVSAFEIHGEQLSLDFNNGSKTLLKVG